MTDASEKVPTESREQSRLSALAVWSLALGIPSYIFLGPLTAIPSVVCGHAALSRIRKSAGRLTGKGLAVAGLTVSYISLFIYLVVLPVLLVPRLMVSPEERCRDNVSTMVDAFWKFVEAEQEWPWELEQLEPYVEDRDIFFCPAATNRSVFSYELIMGYAPTAFGRPNHNIAIRERELNHDGKRTIGRFDGTVEMTDE